MLKQQILYNINSRQLLVRFLDKSLVITKKHIYVKCLYVKNMIVIPFIVKILTRQICVQDYSSWTLTKSIRFLGLLFFII